MWRVWARGTLATWRERLEMEVLDAAMFGFRPGQGTRHVGQLLGDLLVVCRRRRQGLWVASFDLKKCYDMVPWWLVSGVMAQLGVPSRVGAVFGSYYAGLERHFRYGQRSGAPWTARNGLPQGCPAAPDLLNMIMAVFHAWVRRQGLGIEVAGCRLAALSYADDVAVVASSLTQLQVLIGGFLEFCRLAGFEVGVPTMQVWSSQPG